MTTNYDSPATTNMADDEDVQPEVLQPCAVCRRKFIPGSLEKHVKICERAAARKRKPFDSAKQRIQGTELAEFLPKQHQTSVDSRRSNGPHHDDRPYPRPNNAWKQTRDEFLRAIRAARGHNVPNRSQHQHHQHQNHQHPHQQYGTAQHSGQSTHQRPSTLSLVTSPGAPMRSNEKGQCPTCQRQFGVKSYERHVAFCKERSTRLPASPQTSNNVAKERLEARMKYRAPLLKSKRSSNREKYSPGSQKTFVQSPLLARTPVKDTNSSPISSKSNEIVSPKLPLLKRIGKPSKESLPLNTGPLKSRPTDRYNRSPDSQESSNLETPKNPSMLRQLFTPRRLVVLSDVFPSKILQSKDSRSLMPTQRSSGKLISNFLQKEVDNSLERSTESTENRAKKKIKLKNRDKEKKQNNEKNEATNKNEFITWKQVHDDVRKNNDTVNADNEKEQNITDKTALNEEIFNIEEYEPNANDMDRHSAESSICLDDSTNKSEELNSQLLNSENEPDQDIICSDESSNITLNQLYFVKDPKKLDSSSFTLKNSSTTFNIHLNRTNVDNYDSDDGISTSSTKTFRKSSNSNTEMNFVDSLELSDLQINSSNLDLNKIKASTENTQTPKDYQTMDDEFENKNKNYKPESSSKFLSTSIKSNSMPNMVELKIKKVSRKQKSNDQNTKHEKIKNNFTTNNCETKIAGSPETKKHDASTQPNSLNRRCATYVIDETRDLTNRHQQQQQLVNDDSSEEKPQKKRRKLQRSSRDNVKDDNTDEIGIESDDENTGTSKIEKSVSKTCSLYLNENKASNNSESEDKTFLVYDYYRNRATSFSDISSARTNDQQMFEVDEDFADDNESNASELIKEIDISIRNSDMQVNLDNNASVSEDSLFDVSNKMKGLNISSKARNDVKVEKSRKTRLGCSLIERKEGTWISTYEVSDIKSQQADKSTQHFEKEICTITRLDSISREDSILPSIRSKVSVQTQDWKGRLEYHREKLVKSRSKSRVLELEKLKEDDKETHVNLEEHPVNRVCPPIRRLLHSDRSLLRRSFERLPRTDWNNYGCRHPDFSMILRDRTGVNKDYDPFLLAEQQLNDLFSDTSDQSSTDGSTIYPPRKPTSSPNFPLSHHSSAFAKYPNPGSGGGQQQSSNSDKPLQRGSLIAPPSGFDDQTSSDLSSECTDGLAIPRELPSTSSTPNSLAGHRGQTEHVLGRRIIIDQSQALGGGEFAPVGEQRSSKTANGSVSRLARPMAASTRSISVPKLPERKISSSSSSGSSDLSRGSNVKGRLVQQNCNSNGTSMQQRGGSDLKCLNGSNLKSDLKSLNGSNLSLSSIISSSDLEMKRSHSLFDELLSTIEDDANASSSTLPSLMTLMRNDTSLSLLSSTPQPQNGINGHHQRPSANGRINCSDDDGDSSSPESIKRQECGGKLSADSAYSSLNRKHSNYGRNTIDISSSKLKMSKFCHECGFKFPDSAKFCCECGVKRLTL